MYRLLIADDESLVQVGIKSMINWSELNIELCGIAMNGKAALEIIEKQPAFIILTSYEDFQMVKEALRYQVTDYLVKIELTALFPILRTLPTTPNAVTYSIFHCSEKP